MANQPTTGVITNNVLSSFSILEPEKFNKLFRQYGKQHLTVFAFLKTMGFIAPVSNRTYSHFNEDWIHTSITPVITGGGANAAATLTLSGADVASDGSVYPLVGDQVMNKLGVTGIVTAVASAVVTVYPDVLGSDFAAGYAAGDTVIIYAGRYAEGSDSPSGRYSKATEESFNTKILKEAVETTGTALCEKIWVNGMSDGSSNGETWWTLKGLQDAEYRMQLKMGGSFLFDQAVTNTAAHLTGSTDSNTTGLDGWITAGGNVGSYTAGAFSLSDFDYMSRVLDKYDAPLDFAFFAGINLYQDIENSMSNIFTQNPILFVNGTPKTYAQAIYGQNPAEAQGQSVNIGFRCINKTNRNYHIVRLGELSNPQTFNAAGFNKATLGYVCPLDTKDVATPSGGNKTIPSIGMRYLKSPDGKQDRMMQTWMEGGQAPIPTSGYDKLKVNYLAEYGTEFFGASRFFKWQAA